MARHSSTSNYLSDVQSPEHAQEKTSMDFEPDKILEVLKKLLEAVGFHPPLWLTRTFAYGVLVGFLLCAIWGFLYVLSKIKELSTEFIPPRMNRETRRRLSRRRLFADHVESEIRRLNSEQSWSDYRFTELEAEVEAEGRRRALPFLPFFLPRTTSGLRREKSLTKAIDVSREKLILIEGDPGSGKSVALRHVVMKLAGRAKRRGIRTIVPLYINLKEIERARERNIERGLIEEFVLKCLNRANDRDVEEFLEEEFDKGLEEGAWLFLFDSFDEIPEILGSTEPDAVIREYTGAIEDFLHGLNRCRGVVASRYFRGPGQVPWPRFRILPLSQERREELVRKTDLPPVLERELLGRLPLIAEQMGDQAKNPLFLGLICEHMKSGRPFPESGHTLFEGYIDQRLTRDADRIRRRYLLDITFVRRIAEQVAFCMAADQGLGLSPARERIPESMARHGFEVHSVLSKCLDALEFIKLGRAESNQVKSEKLFTFAHRRFQEYFATCLVLSSPGRVTPGRLLLDGRWRETAVVICQTAPPAALEPFFSEVRGFFESLPALGAPDADQEPEIRDFSWPPGILHVLGLLQDGFAGRMDDLPRDIRTFAGSWVESVMTTGTLSDRKWALEVCGAIEESVLLNTLRKAFSGYSRWIAEVAYRQVARLREIPKDIEVEVLKEMGRFYLHGGFWHSRHTTMAHLNRLDRPERFLPSYRILLALPMIDGVMHFFFFVFGMLFSDLGGWAAMALFPLGLSLLSFRRVGAFTYPLNNRLFRQIGLRYGQIDLLYFLFIIRAPIFIVVISLLEVKSGTSFCLAFFVILWAPAAFLAAEEGRFAAILWWPILPALMPTLALSRIIMRFKITAVRLRPLLSFLGLTLLLIPAFAVVVVLFPPIAVFWAAREMVAWNRNTRMLRSQISAEALINGLKLFQWSRSRAQLIKLVRARMLIRPSADAEMKVARLASNVERALNGAKTEDRRWSPQALDELCRLREVLRTEPLAAVDRPNPLPSHQEQPHPAR